MNQPVLCPELVEACPHVDPSQVLIFGPQAVDHIFDLYEEFTAGADFCIGMTCLSTTAAGDRAVIYASRDQQGLIGYADFSGPPQPDRKWGALAPALFNPSRLDSSVESCFGTAHSLRSFARPGAGAGFRRAKAPG